VPARLVIVDVFAETRGACSLVPGPCGSTVCRHALVERTTRGVLRKRRRPQDLGSNCAIREARDQPDGLTLETVGRKLGLTRERVRQVEVSALRKLGVFGRVLGAAQSS
jgi:hypothetical protein